MACEAKFGVKQVDFPFFAEKVMWDSYRERPPPRWDMAVPPWGHREVRYCISVG